MYDLDQNEIKNLIKKVKKLEVKLKRSEANRELLQGMKEKDQSLLKMMRSEINEAMKVIEEKNEKITLEMEKSDKLLLNILPVRVANDLKERGTTTPEYFENVTVFFSDIVDFTKISSKLSPTVLIDELNTIFTAFDSIVESNNCERIKTIGDAYMAVGGMSIPDSNHAKNMVKSAVQIIQYLNERNQTSDIQWNIRIGLHTGSIVGGVVGVKKYIYDVFGDTVNTASRMETNSERMKINISDATYQLVKNDFTCIERESIKVKGKDRMKMWFVEPR